MERDQLKQENMLTQERLAVEHKNEVEELKAKIKIIEQEREKEKEENV